VQNFATILLYFLLLNYVFSLIYYKKSALNRFLFKKIIINVFFKMIVSTGGGRDPFPAGGGCGKICHYPAPLPCLQPPLATIYQITKWLHPSCESVDKRVWLKERKIDKSFTIFERVFM
jgi:hypothetical protein